METIPLVRKSDAVKVIAELLQSEDELAHELQHQRTRNALLQLAFAILVVLFAALLYAAL